MSLADILIVGLAAARVYQLLAHDTILDRPRQALYDRFPKVDDLLSCPWCAGFWLAVFAAGVWHTDFRWVILLAAIAQVTSLFGLAGNRLSADSVNVEVVETVTVEGETYT